MVVSLPERLRSALQVITFTLCVKVLKLQLYFCAGSHPSCPFFGALAAVVTKFGAPFHLLEPWMQQCIIHLLIKAWWLGCNWQLKQQRISPSIFPSAPDLSRHTSAWPTLLQLQEDKQGHKIAPFQCSTLPNHFSTLAQWGICGSFLKKPDFAGSILGCNSCGKNRESQLMILSLAVQPSFLKSVTIYLPSFVLRKWIALSAPLLNASMDS